MATQDAVPHPDPAVAQSLDDLRVRRADFWRSVARIATGVFIALVLWTISMWVVAAALIESAFDDEPDTTIDESWYE